MGIKKILAILIAVALVLGLMLPAFAEDGKSVLDEKNAKITKAQAKEIAGKMLKDYFNIEIDEKKFETRIEFRQDYERPGSYIWEMDWNQYDNEKSVNIHASVDGNDGKILGINKYEYSHGQQQPTIATITEEDARKIGEEFIKKINPKEFPETIYKDNYLNSYGNGNRPVNYNFRYVRRVDGIEFNNNYIMVEVDSVSGMVNAYNCRWYDMDFPSKDGIIDQRAAEEIFKNQLNMTLTYIPHRRDDYDYDRQVTDVKMVYQRDYSAGYYLEAKEGIMIDWRGKVQDELTIKDLTQKQKQDIFSKAKPIKKGDKEIDQDQATKIMEKKVEEILGEGYGLDQIRYMENDNYWETSGKKVWSAQFRKTEGDGGYDGGSITIDALTEELIAMNSYYGRGEGETFEPKITWEEGYDMAIGAIATYFPDKINQIKTEQVYVKSPYFFNGKEVQQPYYYFHFPRMVDGIPYNQDNITLNFDVKTGELREIRKMWNDEITFPKTDGILTAEEAQEIYLEKNEPQLMYTMINPLEENKKDEPQVKLVYISNAKGDLYPWAYMDAFSGTSLDYNGNEVHMEGDSFKEKINGHWAEKELTLLANQKIIEPKGFEINKEITRMEAIRILVNAKGYQPYMAREAKKLEFGNYNDGDADYKQLQMAVKYGIVENKKMDFDPDGKITREEMAQMIVKWLQYDKLAKAKDIYVLPFKDNGDVSPDKIGYVAICKGLGIIEGSNGYFRPLDHATMVEMAAAVYKALGNMEQTTY